MIDSLPLFHRIAGRKVIVLGEGDGAEAKRRLVERAGGIVVNSIEDGVQLAFIALENPEVLAHRLRQAGLLVNVVDRPDLCDFTVPAIVERSPVLIAVGTGGASAGLAKALRLRLEALLPATLGALARGLAEARTALRQRFPDALRRRRALDAAFSEGGVLDPLRENAAEHLASWLSDDGEAQTTSQIIEIHLRSNDPEDLSLREARLLGQADVLAYEAGTMDVVLARVRADAVRRPIISGAKAPELPGLVVVLRVPRSATKQQ